jgi:hypothetical protein
VIRALLLSLLDDLLDERLAAAMTEGRRDALAERPRVGAWVETGPGYESIFDDRGQVAASVWAVTGGHTGFARRQGRAGITIETRADREEAKEQVLAVLETWADVSAARVT